MNLWIQWCRTIFNCLYSHLNDLINDYCKAIICFAIVYSSLIFAKRCDAKYQFNLPGRHTLSLSNNSTIPINALIFTTFSEMRMCTKMGKNSFEKPWQVMKRQLDTRELMNTDRYFQRVAQAMKWDSLGFHPLPARINMKSF